MATTYQRTETAVLEVTIKDADGTLTNPDTSIKITVTDPDGTAVVDAQDGANVSTGIYTYAYNIAADATRGRYSVVWTFVNGGRTSIEKDVFIVGPAIPVTVDEARDHMRITATDENELIESLINVATDYVETFTRRRLLNTTESVTMDGFPDGYEPLYSPLSSVTSIAYTDTNGDSATVTASVYDVDTTTEPGMIRLAYGQTWPSDLRGDANGVTLTYIAGYSSDATEVPESLKMAIRLLVAHWHENREAATVARGANTDLPFGVRNILWQNRYSGPA